MANPIPLGYDDLLKSLYDWGRSGLIPGTNLVKSYHPATIDPITGVAVSLPATVYSTGDKNDIKTHSAIDLNTLSNTNTAGSNVKDFNINDIPGGPDTANSIMAPLNSDVMLQAALNAKDQEDYETQLSTLKVPTIGDRMVSAVYSTLPLVIDKVDEAKTFYSIQYLAIDTIDTQNIDQSFDFRNETRFRYDLVPTGVPCALPGVLNCYMVAYDLLNPPDIKYEYRNPQIEMYYTPDGNRYYDGGNVSDPDGNTLYVHYSQDHDTNPPWSDA